jgi:TPR repeat protein
VNNDLRNSIYKCCSVSEISKNMKKLLFSLLLIFLSTVNAQTASELERECKANQIASCISLGDKYLFAYEVEEDYFRAAELYQIGCNAGSAKGCSSLALMNNKGWGVKQDKFRAVKLYKKGCDGGYADACVGLGGMYANGEGVRQDKSRALDLFGQACDLKSQLGCEYYARLNTSGVK